MKPRILPLSLLLCTVLGTVSLPAYDDASVIPLPPPEDRGRKAADDRHFPKKVVPPLQSR